MSKHEGADRLRARVAGFQEQLAAKDVTPEPPMKPGVYRVNKDGSGQIEGEDFGEVVDAIVKMANDLKTAVHAIPNIHPPGSFRIAPESFSAETRLLFVSAGNALDSALRVVEDIRREGRIKELKRELAQEMQRAGMAGNPEC